eukprot:TRINITY_DN66502_c6_g15_i1.p2 TRINITY_DN66502_c6_g15~~TRINITY_DN66502_c6_g15_i1.p2  ORF type:complete len:291 (-),score=24.09 TRINITY_DN66502_c6_g15_i1:1967-2839(-)
MGKKKIPMEYIEDPRKRKLCFDKRQIGLLKKAMELCKLAHAEVGLMIIAEDDQSVVEFWSTDKTDLVSRYQALSTNPHYDFTLNDYHTEIATQLALKPYPLAAAEEFARGLGNSIVSDIESERSCGLPPAKRPRCEGSPISSTPSSSQPASPISPQPSNWSAQHEQVTASLQAQIAALGQLCENSYFTQQQPQQSTGPVYNAANPCVATATNNSPVAVDPQPTTFAPNQSLSRESSSSCESIDTYVPEAAQSLMDQQQTADQCGFSVTDMLGDWDAFNATGGWGKTPVSV